MSVDHQQTARVNVDNRTWRTFRILALEAERSIADYLGQLVVHELRRARRRKPQPDPADDSPVEARPEPEPRRKGRSIRLADAELLTGLPQPGRRSSEPAPTSGGIMGSATKGHDG